jgi:hypothetical protein
MNRATRLAAASLARRFALAFKCACDAFRSWNIHPETRNIAAFDRRSTRILALQIRGLASDFASLQFSKRPSENTKRRQVAAGECFNLAGPTGLEPSTSGVTGRRSNRRKPSRVSPPSGPLRRARPLPSRVSRRSGPLPPGRVTCFTESLSVCHGRASRARHGGCACAPTCDTARRGGCACAPTYDTASRGGCAYAPTCDTASRGGCAYAPACDTASRGGCACAPTCDTASRGGCACTPTCDTARRGVRTCAPGV